MEPTLRMTTWRTRSLNAVCFSSVSWSATKHSAISGLNNAGLNGPINFPSAVLLWKPTRSVHGTIVSAIRLYIPLTSERLRIEQWKTSAKLGIGVGHIACSCYYDWACRGLYWSRRTALAGTSKALSVALTMVNHPISTVISTMPASPIRLLARL